MKNKALHYLLGLCLVLGALGMPLTNATQAAVFSMDLPGGFIAEPVIQGPGAFGGGEVPTSMAWAPDGRLFIGLKSGRIRIWQNGAFLANDFIDLRDVVSDNVDRGLEGLAVHPNFPAQPYVYAYYVYDPVGLPVNQRDQDGARVSRMVKLKADSTTGYNEAASISDPEREVVLLGQNSVLSAIGSTTSFTAGESCFNKTVGVVAYAGYVPDCLPQDSSTHAGGALAFGPAGNLFVSIGDGAGYGTVDPRGLRAISLNSIAGKVLRIDPLTGNGVAGNPNFNVGSPGSDLSKIYSRGMRNPFRIAVNPVNGLPYVGDIGDGTWEEINAGPGNYGWPCYEGGNAVSLPQPGYANDPSTKPTCDGFSAAAVLPSVYAYQHYFPTGSSNNYSEGAIIAGAFFSGTNYPAEYDRALFFTDYVHDWIRYLKFDNNLNVTGVYTFANELLTQPNKGPVQLSVGPDNNLYVLVFDWTGNSSLTRIRYVGGNNNQPIASAQAMPTNGPIPLNVQFIGSGSSDPDLQILTYGWDLGNGEFTTTVSPVYTYTVAGAYTVTLTVTDTGGLSDSARLYVTAGNTAPVVTITTPTTATTWAVGDVINYSGSASDAEDGALAGTSLNWEIGIVHGSHNHPAIHTSIGATGSFTAPDHGNNVYFELCLTATDAGGLKTRKCVNSDPKLVTIQFKSVPSAQQIAFAGVYGVTPFTATTIVNSQQAIAAPLSQNGLNWQSWSDGKPNSYTTTIPATNQMLTATYLAAPPVAVITATASSAVAPALVTLDGSGSTANGTNAGIQTYLWNFGDGYTSTLVTPTHVFPNGGAYSVTLTVTNFVNQAAMATRVINLQVPATNGTNLPLGLQVADIGAAVINAPEALGSGSNYQNNQLVTCSRNAGDIYNESDGLLLTYRKVSGDSEIIGRLIDVSRRVGQYGNKAGVMLRESLTAGAKSVWIGTSVVYEGDPNSPDARFTQRYHWRPQTDGMSDGVNVGVGGGTLPTWFRLSRTGNTFVGYLSGDGVAWTPVATQTIQMVGTIYAGYATTSIDNTLFNCAQFDNLIINNNPVQGPPPTAVLTATPTSSSAPLVVSFDGTGSSAQGTTPGIRFYEWNFGDGYSSMLPTPTHVYRAPGAYIAQLTVTNFDDVTATTSTPINVLAEAALPTPWVQTDLNVASLAGLSSYDANGLLATCGSGNDIQGAVDSFQFAFRSMQGNGELTARMRNMDLTGPFGGKAGLMIRETAQPGAKYMMLLQKRDQNPLDESIQTQLRTDANGDTSYNYVGPYAQPQWMRLNRTGDVFSAYVSSDGITWTLAQSSTIAMTDTVLAGFAVTSVDNTQLNCALYDSSVFTDTPLLPIETKWILFMPLIKKNP